jgi:hypothetical protein
MKTLIYLAGAGSTGKTTSRRVYCGETYNQQAIVQPDGKRFICTTYPSTAFSVAGNHVSGSDSNVGPDLIYQSMLKCIELSDVVFFDGVMCSPRHVDFANQLFDAVLVLHFDFTPEEVFGRLIGRRMMAGKGSTLPDKTKANSAAFIKRAANAVKYFENGCTKPLVVKKVAFSETTTEICQKITQGLSECWSTPTNP